MKVHHSVPSKQCSAGRFLVHLFFVWTVGCGADSGTELIDGGEFRRMADVVVGEEAALGRVLAVVPLGSDSLAVLESSEPFVTLIDLDGPRVLERFGRKGDGPGEFQRPWTAVAHGGYLYVQDADRITKIRIDQTEEAERLPLPPRIASMAIGCGDALLAVYEGVQEQSRRITYGLLVFSQGQWKDLSAIPLRNDPLVLGTSELNPFPIDDRGLAILNYGTQTIDVISCAGDLSGHSSVYIPANWRSFFLFSRGTGRMADGSLLAMYARGETRDTTLVTYYEGDSLRHALIRGDVRLHDRDSRNRRVWLLHNSPVPLLYGIERDAFSRVFLQAGR